MMEINVKRWGSTLIPATPMDEEAIRELRDNAEYTVKLKRDRSGKHHRFFCAILTKVVDNHAEYNKPDQLLLWLKVRLGYVEEVRFHDDKVWFVAKSTNFSAMEQNEFKKFVDAALDLIISEVILGMNKQELIKEVEEMMGINYEDVWRRT